MTTDQLIQVDPGAHEKYNMQILAHFDPHNRTIIIFAALRFLSDL